MKGLLSMAREKRQTTGQQFKPLSKLNLQKHQPQPSSYLDDQDQQQYEPDEEQIIAYAQYLGIKLPEEEDLLFIAREGLMADLPPDWVNQETDDGNIIYTNMRTGQRTLQHPCDEYYRAMVIKQRRKNAPSVNKYGGGVQPIGIAMQQQQAPRKDIDPLVKMEMEKKKKKMEEQKKKQFEDRKKQIKQHFDKKKDELQKQLREKQEKTKRRYDEEIQGQRSKMQKKMTEQQRQQEQKNKKQLDKFERELRAKMQKKLHDDIASEKQKIEKKMKAKREEIRVNLENQLKKAKKQLQEQQKSRMQILAEKDKIISVKKSQHQMMEEQKANIRNQFIQKKLKQNSEQIQAFKVSQEQQYKAKLCKMENQHEEKIKKLETDAPKQHIKFDGIIKQIEEQEREEMKSFQYEIEMLRSLKKAENQEKLENFKHQFWKTKKEQIDRLERQKETHFQKYRRMKQEEFLNRLGEQQKKMNEEYLNSLKVLRSKYQKEEQVIEIEGRGKKNDGALEKQSIELLNQVVDKLNWKEQNLKREIESLRSEIKKLSQQVKPVKYKLKDEELRMYNMIKECMEKQ